MKIQKKYLEILQMIVCNCKDIPLKEGRVRDSFLKELNPLLATFIAERRTVIEKFCDKDEKGKPIIVKEGKKITYTFPPEDNAELESEIQILKEEEVELQTTPELKAILEKTTYNPAVGESEAIDLIFSLI